MSDLMMDENGCFLSASAEGGVEYVATIPFLRERKAFPGKGIVYGGYLKIEVPFKDTLDRFRESADRRRKGKPGIRDSLTPFCHLYDQKPVGS